MMETLNEIAHLIDSGFGQPWPRHGLRLLYWFANDCFSFGNDNVMLSKYDPADGDFGFHYFENRYDDYGDKLLPDRDYPYYVVGNLNIKKYPKAEELPEYVLKDKSSDQHNSNTDRIIVSLSKKRQFHRVYVTQHHDRSNYDPNATFRISRGLLTIIRKMCLDTFLEKMGYIQSDLPTPVFSYRPQTTNTVRPNFTAVTPSSSDPAHKQPPSAQNNEIKIQLNDNEKTVSLPTPVVNYRPLTTNTVSSNSTAVTISSSDSDDSEPPEIQTHASTQNSSENLRTTQGFWERFCTIL